MTASQLFVVLGKDGSNFRQLSSEFRVRISLEANPLALRVRGPHNRLDALEERLNERLEVRRSSLPAGLELDPTPAQAIVSETLYSGSAKGIRPDLLQTVSRLGGAFVENLGKGKVCLNPTYK